MNLADEYDSTLISIEDIKQKRNSDDDCYNDDASTSSSTRVSSRSRKSKVDDQFEYQASSQQSGIKNKKPQSAIKKLPGSSTSQPTKVAADLMLLNRIKKNRVCTM